MNRKIKTTLIAAASILTLAAFAPSATAGGCSSSRSGISINFGHGGGLFFSGGSHYDRGYNHGYDSHYSRGHYNQPTYRDTCRVIDTCYFTRGCYRYAKYTYLHERIDCHGHVVKCWRSYKTVCLGRYH